MKQELDGPHWQSSQKNVSQHQQRRILEHQMTLIKDPPVYHLLVTPSTMVRTLPF